MPLSVLDRNVIPLPPRDEARMDHSMRYSSQFISVLSFVILSHSSGSFAQPSLTAITVTDLTSLPEISEKYTDSLGMETSENKETEAQRIFHEHQIMATLLQADFLDDGWSRPYLNQLSHFLSSAEVDKELNGKVAQVRKLGNEFFHQSTDSKNAVRIGDLLFMRSDKVIENNISVIVTFVLRASDGGFQGAVPVGMSVFNFKTQGPNQGESILEYVMTDLNTPQNRAALKGISRSITAFNTRLYQLLGISTERIWAAWTGRVVWAKTHQLDPQEKKYVNGIAIDQNQQLRDNFSRLCQSLGVDPSQLRKTNRMTALSDPVNVNQLNQPSDYIGVFAVNNQGERLQFMERAYVTFATFSKPRLMDLWEVYMMGDLRFDENKDKIIVSWDAQQEVKQSSTRMGTWFGIRHISPSDPS